jgi:hypothetical protein
MERYQICCVFFTQMGFMGFDHLLQHTDLLEHQIRTRIIMSGVNGYVSSLNEDNANFFQLSRVHHLQHRRSV